MTLAELGARLREAREARNMTVADVADRLKIPSRILHGVEEASDRLPRTVYVHHFIKDYARLMGFSPAEVAEWTANLEGFESLSRPALSESAPFTPVKPSMLPVILGALIKAALLGALAFGGYAAYVHFFASRDYEDIVKLPVQEQTAPSVQGAPSVPQAAPVWEPVAPETPAAAMKKAPSEKAAPAAPLTSNDDSRQAQPEAGQDSALPAAQPEAEPAVTQNLIPSAEEAAASPGDAAPLEKTAVEPAEAVAPAAEAPLAVLPEGMHHVEVIAEDGDCWMGFEPDGRKQQRTLRKGDSFTMTFRDSLVMKLGHASAVRVIYDGKEMPRSSSGRVMTMSFPPAE